MGLMDWHIQCPYPLSLAHTCKHVNKPSDFVVLDWMQKERFLISNIIVQIGNTKNLDNGPVMKTGNCVIASVCLCRELQNRHKELFR